MSDGLINKYLKTINRLSVSVPFSVFWVGSYLFINFILNQLLETDLIIDPYIVDISFVLISLVIYWQNLRFKFKLKTVNSFYLILSVIAGMSVYFLAVKNLFMIPFDFSHIKNIMLLILLGPLLEELIFRFSLWVPLMRIIKNKKIVILLTAFVFSYAHYQVIYLLPKDLYSFIYFQTFYTFILGIFWGWRLVKTSNFLSPLLLHIFFNTGFYFGYLLS